MKLFVAGEGPNEIGKWFEHANYWSSSQRGDGVLATLFRKRHEEATVVGGRAWKNARQYRAGVARGDTHALEALTLTASESGAEILVWARDSDGDRGRVEALRTKQEELRREFPSLRLLGGLPNPAIEAWVIAVGRLHENPEALSRRQLKMLAERHDCDSESTMCQLIENSKLDGSESSPSLRDFVSQLEELR